MVMADGLNMPHLTALFSLLLRLKSPNRLLINWLSNFATGLVHKQHKNLFNPGFATLDYVVMRRIPLIPGSA